MKGFILRALIGLSLLGSSYLAAEDSPKSEPQTSALQQEAPLKITLHPEENSAQPGRAFWVLVHFDIKDGWQTYWKNPGDAGMAPRIQWTVPDGWTVGELVWPQPDRFDADGIIGFGYENEMLLMAQITPAKTFAQDSASIKAQVNWLACSDTTCLPGSNQIQASIPVNSSEPQIQTGSAGLFEKIRANIPQNEASLKAEQKNGFIELSISESDQGKFEKAEFFPEDTDVINYKEGARFNAKGTVFLAASNPSAHQLKGVLVLSSDGKKKALEVNIPIQHADQIALLDKPTIQTAPINGTEFEGGFAMALLFAFAGGMILNLMPCVLPVISLKIFSFVKMAGENRSLILKHGIAFSVGVILSFWVLAGALLALQAYGESVGWGFQLQEPLFVAILASIMFILGLSMFGIMEIGTSLTALAGNIKHESKGLTSSFLSGVLATAVATPCTGPFLGSAVGFAVTLPAPLAMLVFTVLGFGMAFPYLLLSAFPSLMRYLPRPGNWMLVFKEIMGFFMMATTLWLLWVFSAQTSNVALMALLVAFFFMGIGCWIYGKWGSPVKTKRTRYISYLFSLGLFAIAIYTFVSATTAPTTHLSAKEQAHEGWETFSPERVAELQAQGIPVFIDFTAKWCLICQANHAVLSLEQVADTFEQKGVVKMKADWTKNDPVITEALRKFGRNSVPLYVLYGANEDKTPQILPQVLTTDVVIDSLKDHE